MLYALQCLQLREKTNPKTIANVSNHNSPVEGWKKLLVRILDSKFKGLSGDVNFRGGALAPSIIFRIVNVVGKS